jgi:hypothetical protein
MVCDYVMTGNSGSGRIVRSKSRFRRILPMELTMSRHASRIFPWLAGAVLAAASLPALAQGPAAAAGIWNGWVVYAPAATEVEVTVELARDGGGAWTATVDVPVQFIAAMAAQRVSVQGRKVSFDLVEASGTSTFSGQIAEDGRTFRGEVTESGEGHSFVLDKLTARRVPPAPQPVRLQWPARPVPPDAGPGPAGGSLQTQFDHDADKVRLLFVVSPTCKGCAIAARVLERYVLDQIADPRLRVYVLWGPMLGDETEASTHRAASHLPDPRVMQFWDPTPAMAKRIGQSVGLKDTAAWDVFLAFPAGERWADPAPAPAYFVHKRGDQLPSDRSFDAAKLRDRVRDLLAAVPAPTATAGRSPAPAVTP